MITIKPFDIIEKDDAYTIRQKRGDTAAFTIEVSKDDTALTGYTGIFSVKRNLDEKTAAFSVPFKAGEAIKITHDMTRGLPFGTYQWDIEIKTGDGEYQTVGPFKYILEADVTY